MADPEPYLQHVSRAHVEASAAALAELAALASTGPSRKGAQLIRLRFGHLDHGGFLTNVRHGFAIMPVTPHGQLLGIEGEILYAIVLNHTVDLQLRTTLSLIASLLARQDMVRAARVPGTDGLDLDITATSVDQRAAVALQDSLRVKNWRDAALEIQQRAAASGYQLDLQFASPLLSQEEISQRAPALRHVYNHLPLARDAVDRVAAMMSRGFVVRGEGVSAEALAASAALLDVGDIRHYTAHIMRDAFVCGNGYLAVPPPPNPLRLYRPEHVEVTSDSFRVRDPVANLRLEVPASGMLHLRGMNQVGGPLGVSTLEPLLILLGQMEQAHYNVEHNVPIALATGTEQARTWAQRAQDFERRIVAENEREVRDILGGGTLSLQPAPPDLYFPGQADASPATGRLHFGESPRS